MQPLPNHSTHIYRASTLPTFATPSTFRRITITSNNGRASLANLPFTPSMNRTRSEGHHHSTRKKKSKTALKPGKHIHQQRIHKLISVLLPKDESQTCQFDPNPNHYEFGSIIRTLESGNIPTLDAFLQILTFLFSKIDYTFTQEPLTKKKSKKSKSDSKSLTNDVILSRAVDILKYLGYPQTITKSKLKSSVQTGPETWKSAMEIINWIVEVFESTDNHFINAISAVDDDESNQLFTEYLKASFPDNNGNCTDEQLEMELKQSFKERNAELTKEIQHLTNAEQMEKKYVAEMMHSKTPLETIVELQQQYQQDVANIQQDQENRANAMTELDQEFREQDKIRIEFESQVKQLDIEINQCKNRLKIQSQNTESMETKYAERTRLKTRYNNLSHETQCLENSILSKTKDFQNTLGQVNELMQQYHNIVGNIFKTYPYESQLPFSESDLVIECIPGASNPSKLVSPDLKTDIGPKLDQMAKHTKFDSQKCSSQLTKDQSRIGSIRKDLNVKNSQLSNLNQQFNFLENQKLDSRKHHQQQVATLKRRIQNCQNMEKQLVSVQYQVSNMKDIFELHQKGIDSKLNYLLKETQTTKRMISKSSGKENIL